MTKKTYRIGDVAELLQLKSYVLRFWETEFPALAPLRTSKGQRLYTEAHVLLLRRIKDLLHEQGMTIEGARRVLSASEKKRGSKKTATAPDLYADTSETPISSNEMTHTPLCPAQLGIVRQELLAIRHLLEPSDATDVESS